MTKSRIRIGISIVISLLISSGSIYAETVLNHYRLGTQVMPTSAKLSDGNLVVGWLSLASQRKGPLFEVYTTDFSPLNSADQYAANNSYLASGRPAIAASEDSFFVAAFKEVVKLIKEHYKKALEERKKAEEKEELRQNNAN